jgi:hypothetical protein
MGVAQQGGGSPAGSVVTGFMNDAGIGLRFSTQP